MLISIANIIRAFIEKLARYMSEADPVYAILLPKAKENLLTGNPVELTLNSAITAIKNRLRGLEHIDFVNSLKVLKPDQLKLISESIANVLKELGNKSWLSEMRDLKTDLDNGIIGNHKLPNFLQNALEMVQNALKNKEDPKVAIGYIDNALMQYKAAQPMLLRAQMTPLRD